VKVTVKPETFTLVLFDSGRIAELAADVAGKVGVSGDLTIDVDEPSALGRARVVSTEPIVLYVQGGAMEDPKRPRQLSERNTCEVLGRLLFRVKDRLDPAFGAVPEDDALSLRQVTAWDAYCLGRLKRLGYELSKPRRQYHFRTRHGFTDVADAAFERLWAADGLTWADIESIIAETSAAQPA
jgi:hypothetical protein